MQLSPQGAKKATELIILKGLDLLKRYGVGVDEAYAMFLCVVVETGYKGYGLKGVKTLLAQAMALVDDMACAREKEAN